MSNTFEPRWVPAVAVQAIHRQQRWSYGELSTIPQLAAATAKAIVRAHPFVDGNKRSGFVVAVVLLGLNGFSFQASNENVVLMIQCLAAGELSWEELEAWFASQSAAIAR